MKATASIYTSDQYHPGTLARLLKYLTNKNVSIDHLSIGQGPLVFVIISTVAVDHRGHIYQLEGFVSGVPTPFVTELPSDSHRSGTETPAMLPGLYERLVAIQHDQAAVKQHLTAIRTSVLSILDEGTNGENYLSKTRFDESTG